MTIDTIKQLGAEFHHAADGVGEALQRLENARADRLSFLRQCSKDSTARLESQTAEDLLRQALEAGRQEQPQPEPFRAGLPPERLRKVWAEWEDEEGDVVTFKDEHYHWSNWRASMPIKRIHDHAWSGLKLKPLGTSWSEVEAMAEEAEKPAEPKMLDLRTLKVGTVCEAVGEIAVPYVFLKLKVGRRFSVVEVMQPPTAEGEDVRVLIGDDTWALPALVPARVVKEGGEQ